MDAGSHQSRQANTHGVSKGICLAFHASTQGTFCDSLFPPKSITVADFSHLPGDEAARLRVSSGKAWNRQLPW